MKEEAEEIKTNIYERFGVEKLYPSKEPDKTTLYSYSLIIF
jgi:hypothetical protein